MSTVVHIHLYCDGECKSPYEGALLGHDSIPRQRERAKRDGWVRAKWKGRMIDLCNACKDSHPSRFVR